MPKPDPIHKASLTDLLCIVQSHSGWLDELGQWVDPYAPKADCEFYTYDEAEAEIERRFEALNRKIKRLEASR